MDYSLLLSDEEYQRYFEEKHQEPPTFELHRNGQALFYFGANHSRDPKNAQWEILDTYWNRFLKEAEANRIVFLEGSPFSFTADKSEEEIIRRYGERGFIIVCAIKENIPIHWADLLVQDEIKKLYECFDKDLVNYFFFARSARSLLRRVGNTELFDVVVAKVVAFITKCIEVPPDPSYYAAIHQKIFGKSLTNTERGTLERAAVPIYHDSIINDIARASGRMRDEYILSEIEHYWLKGFSIFALFGSGHVIAQVKSIKELAGY